MHDASPVLVTLIMFGTLVSLLLLGLNICFALGSSAIVTIMLLWGREALSLTATSAWGVMGYYTLVAVPFFIFMAMMLQASGVIDALFQSVRLWVAGIPGGLAIVVIFICTIIAAMSGVAATGVVSMGILALPRMLKIGYDKTMAIGPILAGGALGFLIPPSVTFVLYGLLARVSIGKLFLGGIIPGLMLASFYIIYIALRCIAKPMLGPPLPKEERISFKEKVLSVKSFILPALIILACLGTIFLGIASPTEAAGVGAAAAVGCAYIYKKLNLKVLKETAYSTLKITGMVMWLVIGAYCFKSVFISIGGPELAREFIGNLNASPFIILIVMQLSYIVLGCFLDDLTIMFITLPVYLPIIESIGFDLVWFGVLFVVNMQIAYLTPPFGMNLFYMRGVAPAGITLGDIYRSIVPFICLQFIGLVLVMLFPALALWLPRFFTNLI